MKSVAFLFIVLIMSACGSNDRTGGRIISVSIAPFGYFTEQIAGDNFAVNVMVPAGANPHIYEPYPNQIDRLRRSEAYICNGYLGFEDGLDGPFSGDKQVDEKCLTSAKASRPIEDEHHHEGEHLERADPHYWASPNAL